jgi:hypothetical protein
MNVGKKDNAEGISRGERDGKGFHFEKRSMIRSPLSPATRAVRMNYSQGVNAVL